MQLSFHFQSRTVGFERQVFERRSLVREDVPVHEVLQADHVHRHVGRLQMDDERSLVVEDRRLLVPTDHRPSQTRYVQHDSVVNVQVDVLHLQLNTCGREAQHGRHSDGKHRGTASGAHEECDRNTRAAYS